MGQNIAKKKFIVGCNTDVSSTQLPPNQARFALNFERTVNTRADGSAGKNEGALTPVPASRELPLPAAAFATYSRHGAFESKKTNITYVWLFNHDDRRADMIYRIHADLSCEVVYQGPIALSPEPMHHIRGAYLWAVAGREYLTWVDGINWQGFLDVQASIGTNSFHVPYFQLGEFEPEQYFQLPTRPPMHCIKGEWIPLASTDAGLMVNRMVDLTWQFRYKWILTDGRETEWSPISSLYYIERAEGQKDAQGLPRCIQLTFPAGHPQVEKVVLAFRNCNGNAFAEENPTDWNQYDVIEKYAGCDPAVPFWQRSIRLDDAEVQYRDDTNDFVYTFCGDKGCTPIAVEDTNRTENPCPVTSFALAAIEDCLALFNNQIGYDQADCALEGEFLVSLDESEGEGAQTCEQEMVDVKVAIVVHNLERSVNEPVFTMDGHGLTSQKLFGGLMYRDWSTPFQNPAPYLQYFPGSQMGFIPYIEGTDTHAITEQYQYTGTTSAGPQFKDSGPELNFNDKAKRRLVSKELRDRTTYYIQMATLRVVKGTKGYIRVGGHRSAPTDDYQSTSTTVIGVLKDLAAYDARTQIDWNNCDLMARELYFDTCKGAVDLSTTPFVVADLTSPYGQLAHPWAATCVSGYLTDKHGGPVARAQCVATGGTDVGLLSGTLIDPNAQPKQFCSLITDHNGFYFFHWTMNWIGFPGALGGRFLVEGPGCTKQLGTQQVFVPGGGAMPNETFEIDSMVNLVDGYEDKYYTSVHLRVRDCRGVAMPDLAVVMPTAKAAITNNSGIAVVKVRNRMPTFGQLWQDRAVLMQGSTGFVICGGSCDTCMPDFLVDLGPCMSGTDGGPLSLDILDAQNRPVVVQVDPFFGVSQGLKPGGRYGYQMVLHDGAGRHTWVPQAVKYLTQPTLQQQGHYGFRGVNYVLPVAGYPDWVRHISLVRTANLQYEFALQWAADAIVFADPTGKPTSATAAEKLRLSVKSLQDFATTHAAANISYSFMVGDRLQILADDTGRLFDSTVGVLDFLIEGVALTTQDPQDPKGTVPAYQLIIPMDDRLKNLKPGCLLQIVRPNACVGEQPFFELCDTIDVVNGVPVMISGAFSTFDTYQVRRSIYWDQQRHIFAFPFEHYGPSDFWGGHCEDRGRVFFKNIYAGRVHEGRSAWLSDAILENGNRNGLSTFREVRSLIFSGEKRGDIVKVWGEDRSVKILCERGNFTAVVGDNLLRVNRQGVVGDAPAASVLVETSNSSSVFGMHYDDVEACWWDNGFFCWVDRLQKALVLETGQGITDVSMGRFSAYLSDKLQLVETYNQDKTGLDRIMLQMGYDPISRAVFLTFFAQGWADGFIANRDNWRVDGNETLGVSTLDGSLFAYSFTPEGYAVLSNSIKGAVFFSFKNGVPWVHRERGAVTFNQFFGVACDQRVILVLNEEPDKVKMALAMQVQSLTKYYCDRISSKMTDTRTGVVYDLESEIPPGAMKFTLNKWDGAFLMNRLAPGKAMPLYQGEVMRGYYFEVSLVRDNCQGIRLDLRDDTKRVKYNELDSILFTYAHSEQSAFNQ